MIYKSDIVSFYGWALTGPTEIWTWTVTLMNSHTHEQMNSHTHEQSHEWRASEFVIDIHSLLND